MIKKQLKEFYTRYRFIIWPVVTGLSSAVILIFIIMPQLMSYLNVRGQIGQLQSRVNSLDVKAQELQKLDERQITRQFQSVFTVFPADPGIPSALVVLQDLAEQTGVVINSTTYVTGQRSSAKNSFILNLTITGSISGIRSFLTSLNSSTRLFQVDAISAHFTKSSVLEVEVPVSVYYQPSSPLSWSVEQEIPQFSGNDQKFLTNLIQAVDSANQRIKAQEASYSAVPIGKLNLFD